MKIVGCEFSKYIQLLEGRQKKIRRYKEENIKPLPTTLTATEEIIEIETMLRNSQYNWMQIEKPLDKDKWIIRHKESGRVHFEGTPQVIIETIKEITQNK